jgi:hypothetical protein
MKKISTPVLVLTVALFSCGSDSGKTDYDVIGSGSGGLAAAWKNIIKSAD